MEFHNFIRDGEGWRSIKNDLQYRNPYLQVFTQHVTTPTREHCTWTLVHRKGAAVVAPMTAEGKFLLVQQERIPIRASIWEFPAGQVDENAEQQETLVRETALRELREESGYQLAPEGELIYLGHFFPSAGFTDEHSHLFLAKPVIPDNHGRQPDENEAITECRAFSPDELRSMIASNEIRDANTLAAFARLTAMGLI